jgi:flagellar biosynthesis protein FlhA
MLIIPLPTWMLDVLLIGNLSLSIMIILSTIYIKKPADFSSFPTLILMTTVFGLALNVSSTRLILTDGYAGKIIEAFGNFVIRGNLVVGLIIFIVLLAIQFLVITKGASRVAEVAARFTLDAMPGKQLAINEDLNAGLINEEEARKRREELRLEADFYGNMDGSSKFVSGNVKVAWSSPSWTSSAVSSSAWS